MTNHAANLLKKNTEKILEIWTKRAQREIGEALPLERVDLRDSLPEYLAQMAGALSKTVKRTSARKAHDKSESKRIGNEHGHDRAFFSHYSIDEVIFEFHLLREVIFEVLEEAKPLSSRDRDIIISSIEQAVNYSATHFAKQLREMQKKTIVTLTHDLRTPVSISKISAELILKYHKKDAIGNLALRIVNNMERIDLMVDELLDATRIRAMKNMGLEFQNLDLTKLAGKICTELKIVFGNHIVFKPKERILGYWSEQGLHRLIENLISNAVKYGTKNSTITVSVSRVSKGVRIEVHNKGNPIRKEEIPLLFEDYARGADTKDQIGWGIGLALVKAVVVAHHGKIEVESSIQKGTSFIILLPKDFRKATSRKNAPEVQQTLQH